MATGTTEEGREGRMLDFAEQLCAALIKVAEQEDWSFKEAFGVLGVMKSYLADGIAGAGYRRHGPDPDLKFEPLYRALERLEERTKEFVSSILHEAAHHPERVGEIVARLDSIHARYVMELSPFIQERKGE